MPVSLVNSENLTGPERTATHLGPGVPRAENAKIRAFKILTLRRCCRTRVDLRILKTGGRADALPGQPVDAQCSEGSDGRVAMSEPV
jgi:hypothetical protein